MKKLPVILLLVAIIKPYSVHAGGDFPHLSGFPSYREACTYFFNHADISRIADEDFYRFRFARKPGGWIVYAEEINGGSVVVTGTTRVWDPGKGYLLPDTGRNDDTPDRDELVNYLTNNALYNYAIHPFYGYDKWAEDVIKYFGKIPAQDLSDDELYGTARAYSQYSSDLFWTHGSFSSTPVLIKDHRQKALKKFLRYARKGIACFKALYTRNPQYQTLVGSMGVKYNNEIMAKWYELMVFGFDRQANHLLESAAGEENLYEGFWQSFAKGMLSLADSNAVLFTNGDNDTYPLLYEQYQNHTRTDVRIINISLLNDPVYYKAVLSGLTGRSAIVAGIPGNEYALVANRGIYISPSAGSEMQYLKAWREQALEQLKSKNTTISLNRAIYQYTYPSGLGQEDTIRTGKALPNSLTPALFIIPSLIMDLLPKHPVYFSKGCIQAVSDLFSPDNFVSQVLVYRLSGGNAIRTDGSFINRNNSYTDTSLCRRFLNQPRIDLPGINDPAQQRTFSWVLDDISLYIKTLSEDNGKKETLALTRKYFSEFPLWRCGVNHDHCRMLNLQLASQPGISGTAFEKEVQDMLSAIRSAVGSFEMSDREAYDDFNGRYLSWCISLLMTGGPGNGPETYYRELEKLQEELHGRMSERLSISSY